MIFIIPPDIYVTCLDLFVN